MIPHRTQQSVCSPSPLFFFEFCFLPLSPPAVIVWPPSLLPQGQVNSLPPRAKGFFSFCGIPLLGFFCLFSFGLTSDPFDGFVSLYFGIQAGAKKGQRHSGKSSLPRQSSNPLAPDASTEALLMQKPGSKKKHIAFNKEE